MREKYFCVMASSSKLLALMKKNAEIALNTKIKNGLEGMSYLKARECM